MWVNLHVTPCDGLFDSGFDGITDFAVVLVSAFSELQALYISLFQTNKSIKYST